MDKITEKKLKNKRFRASETSIVTALLSAKDKLNLAQLIRIAHISRSTVHRHHGNIINIVPNYEKYLLRKCKATLGRLMKIENIHLEFLYERLMIFLSNNQQIVTLILKSGNSNFAEQLVSILKPKIISTTKLSDGEALTLHCKEIAGLIELWCRSGFDKSDVATIIDKIRYLTDAAYVHLGPLATLDHSKPSISN